MKKKLTINEEIENISGISLNGGLLSKEEVDAISTKYNDINLVEDCENFIEEFDDHGKYSFKVRNSYDTMKYEILKKAYNEMTLDELILKFK